MEVLYQLKKSFPNGRFWLKADATDVKICLQESLTGVWNGDSQLEPVIILLDKCHFSLETTKI